MPNDDFLERLLHGIDIDLPEKGSGAPPQEDDDVAKKKVSPEDIVFLQKIVTEVWIYTDVEKKTYGTASTQDIVVHGEMSREEAMKIIDAKKGRRRKKSD